jgi:hypothetical protein
MGFLNGLCWVTVICTLSSFVKKTLRKGFHCTIKLRVNSRGIDPGYISHKFVELFRRQDGRFFRFMPSFVVRVVKIVYKIQAVWRLNRNVKQCFRSMCTRNVISYLAGWNIIIPPRNHADGRVSRRVE